MWLEFSWLFSKMNGTREVTYIGNVTFFMRRYTLKSMAELHYLKIKSQLNEASYSWQMRSELIVKITLTVQFESNVEHCLQ